jgi:hypothetical protein
LWRLERLAMQDKLELLMLLLLDIRMLELVLRLAKLLKLGETLQLMLLSGVGVATAAAVVADGAGQLLLLLHQLERERLLLV